jgi:uncharacterized protein DUF5995
VRRGITTALAIAALTAATGAAAASGGGANWVEYLPPGTSPNERHRGPIPHCKKAKPKCIKVVIRRLQGAQARFGCDHRAVFATTYLVLTETFFEALRRDPELVEHRKYLYREDALFANFYFHTLRRAERGQEVPPAWEIAFETARSGEVNAAQDMLLGINAHVQSDMPFVIEALGLRTRDGDSRKPDHDATNEVLEEAYQRVVDEVERRYDPMLAATNPDGVPVDDAAGLELVRSWRERVWRNAERLANADSDSEWRQIAHEIHSQAADWARGIAGYQQPGERVRRDAYCRAQLGSG